MPIEGRKTVQLDGFKNTRKLEVGIMISCPMISSRTTSDEMGHNPQAQDLPRSKHILAEGKTLEEDTIFIGRQFYRSNAKPESCEGTIDVCLACRINGLFRTQFMDKRNSTMLVRMTEC